MAKRRTITVRAMIAEKRVRLPLIDDVLADERPKTRGECVDGPRPCPWAGCRYHLFLDIDPWTGNLRLPPSDEPVEDQIAAMTDSCALDLADERGGMVLESIAPLLHLTRERVRQLEVKAVKLVQVRMKRRDD
jgi:hypothetical protein